MVQFPLLSTQHIELVKVMEEWLHLSDRQLLVRLYEKHLSLLIQKRMFQNVIRLKW